MTRGPALPDGVAVGGQQHLFANWESRPAEMQRRLLDDLTELDEELLVQLRGQLGAAGDPPVGHVEPAPVIHASAAYRRHGDEHISAGKTGFLLVAGGQGSRLGFDGPKGCYPVTPLRDATLFQLFSEKIAAARRRYGCALPWFIMTSGQNHRDTTAFFDEHEYFGLDAATVHFFPQRLVPSLDEAGRTVLAPDGGLFQNPDGHGGVVRALAESGAFEQLRAGGVEELFYFQVDNPLVEIPDPTFLGAHLANGAEMSSKVVRKAFTEEKLGAAVTVDGVPHVIEYSDIDPALAAATDADGNLRYGWGSIAIHVINVAFLERIGSELPWHVARKRIECLAADDPNLGRHSSDGVKFERFIFDAIPRAANSLFFATDREIEFAPLKNRDGVDSIATSRAGQIAKCARWLEQAGISVPRTADGTSQFAIEITPSFALYASDLSARADRADIVIDGDTLLDDAANADNR